MEKTTNVQLKNDTKEAKEKKQLKKERQKQKRKSELFLKRMYHENASDSSLDEDDIKTCQFYFSKF